MSTQNTQDTLTLMELVNSEGKKLELKNIHRFCNGQKENPIIDFLAFDSDIVPKAIKDTDQVKDAVMQLAQEGWFKDIESAMQRYKENTVLSERLKPRIYYNPLSKLHTDQYSLKAKLLETAIVGTGAYGIIDNVPGSILLSAGMLVGWELSRRGISQRTRQQINDDRSFIASYDSFMANMKEAKVRVRYSAIIAQKVISALNEVKKPSDMDSPHVTPARVNFNSLNREIVQTYQKMNLL